MRFCAGDKASGELEEDMNLVIIVVIIIIVIIIIVKIIVSAMVNDSVLHQFGISYVSKKCLTSNLKSTAAIVVR